MVSQAGQLDLVIYGSNHSNSGIFHREKSLDIAGLGQLITYNDELPVSAGSLEGLENL